MRNPTRSLSYATALTIALSSQLISGSPAAPATQSGFLFDSGQICAPNFSSVNYPCCPDVLGDFDVCNQSVTVTPSSVATCQPCNFTYDVEITCASCGSIQIDGQSGLSCGHRENNTFSCPDGMGNGLMLKFECGVCMVLAEEH